MPGRCGCARAALPETPAECLLPLSPQRHGALLADSAGNGLDENLGWHAYLHGQGAKADRAHVGLEV